MSNNEMQAFTFGDPVEVIDRRELLDYVESMLVGKWYEPPVPFESLSQMYRATVHHTSPLLLKRNVLVSTFVAHPLLSAAAFSRFVMDYLVFGNAYLEVVRNLRGGLMPLRPALARYMRRGADLETYYMLLPGGQYHEFAPGAMYHMLDDDINQEVYGLPEYLAATNSILLNESATLFRRRYYKNGSHAGFVFYMTDAAQNPKDIDALREALRSSKGPGNFRNLFLYAPGGKKDGVQLIPVSEVAAKDDFLNIKGVTRDDQLAAHRVPPQLLGIVPTNTGGFGDVEKAARVFAINELAPLQTRLTALNDWLGVEVVRFKPYALQDDAAPKTN